MTHQSGDGLFIVPHFPLVICIQSSLKIWGNVKWQICRNMPPKKRQFCSYPFSQSWIIGLFFFFLPAVTVVSPKTKYALVTAGRHCYKLSSERKGGKKIVYFTREAPKGVCIDLRTNHCQCVQVLQKKRES